MAEREGSTLFGEVRRMVRTSGAVTGIAARVAGERFLGLKTDKAAHAEDLKAILGGLKGPMMKVAQFLSTVPDALPEEYARELSQLQSNAPPMGWAFVKRRMAAELGPDWQAKFAAFGREAAAAASLGQVHRARLPDGTEVACKLQYPDMPSVVEADLKQLRLAMQLYRRMDSSLDNEDAYAELQARLREELDYLREAAHQRLYGIMLRDTPEVHVPRPVMPLCTRRLLTMTWLEGRALMARLAENPPQEERNAYARALFLAWYVPFYRYGVIHGDPHLGNYTVRPDLSLNLLDFGCVRIFPPRFVQGVIDLYWALVRKDRDLAIHAYESWGFRGLTNELVEIMNEWAAFLYRPLMENRTRPISETNSGQAGRKVVEQIHARLREVGGVVVPREFVFMDRAAIGLGSVFLHLGAELNWYALFMELIDGFDLGALAARQAQALEAAGLRPPG